MSDTPKQILIALNETRIFIRFVEFEMKYTKVQTYAIIKVGFDSHFAFKCYIMQFEASLHKRASTDSLSGRPRNKI